MSSKRFYRRRFLNLRGFHSGAYVWANCEIEVVPPGRAVTYWVESEISVGDCGRVATIDFRVYNESDARNALYKARLLRDVLIDFTTALETAVDDWRSMQK